MSRYSLLTKMAGVKENAVVADCGCGSGKGVLFIIKTRPKLLVLIDNDFRKLSQVFQTFGKKRQLVFNCGDIKELNFNNFFDYFYCVETLEHLKEEDNKKAIASITRSMKKGGRLCLSLPGANYVRGAEHLQFLPYEKVRELFEADFDFIQHGTYRKYKTKVTGSERHKMFANLLVFEKRKGEKSNNAKTKADD